MLLCPSINLCAFPLKPPRQCSIGGRWQRLVEGVSSDHFHRDVPSRVINDGETEPEISQFAHHPAPRPGRETREWSWDPAWRHAQLAMKNPGIGLSLEEENEYVFYKRDS
ncbi:hypothetical protein RRG08_064723 [Elysia crispata]|uniref:Uncharacterized protein n=1 Tax=Elysia crispata TaxID=231223 RepID=A0AAE1D7D5_9GAST|nr:hypothetical protein RRG08_064723 [Elysia crispata]